MNWPSYAQPDAFDSSTVSTIFAQFLWRSSPTSGTSTATINVSFMGGNVPHGADIR